MLEGILGKKPDFVNENGKFWIDKDMCLYLKKKKLKGTAFIVELMAGERVRILVDDDSNLLYEITTLEEMAVHIDILSLSERK